MNFEASTGLPIAHAAEPDILHDLQVLRREESDHPGTLQDVQPRDFKSAWERLKAYRLVATSPASTDEARDRAIESGTALIDAMQDLYFIRIRKITVLACDCCETGPATNTGPMSPEETKLYLALQAAITAYLTASGFAHTSRGMELSMSKPPEVTA